MLRLTASALLLLQGCQIEMAEESDEAGSSPSLDMAHGSDGGNSGPFPDVVIDAMSLFSDMELHDAVPLPPDMEPIEPLFGCEEACLRLSDCAWDICDNPDLNQLCLEYCQEHPSIVGVLEEKSCNQLLNLIERMIPGSCTPPSSDCAQICEAFGSCVEVEEILSR